MYKDEMIWYIYKGIRNELTFYIHKDEMTRYD